MGLAAGKRLGWLAGLRSGRNGAARGHLAVIGRAFPGALAAAWQDESIPPRVPWRTALGGEDR